MWVTISQGVDILKPAFASFPLMGFTHNLSHKLNGFNSPLTWGYEGFPQENTLVTTTTYNYMKTPVRFPLVDFLINYLKQKTCKVLLQREG